MKRDTTKEKLLYLNYIELFDGQFFRTYGAVSGMRIAPEGRTTCLGDAPQTIKNFSIVVKIAQFQNTFSYMLRAALLVHLKESLGGTR